MSVLGRKRTYQTHRIARRIKEAMPSLIFGGINNNV